MMEKDNPLSTDNVKLHTVKLTGIDWANNALFFTHRWIDETSQFDKCGRWNCGLECYERDYACRVPVAIQNCEELIESFVSMMIDNHPDAEGFWV